MDIWLTKCSKRATCSHCRLPITNGSPMVVGNLWRDRKSAEGLPLKWKIRLHWHVSRPKDSICCWIEAGLAALDKRPHIENRGRKRLALTDEQRVSRLKLLQARARVIQMIKSDTENPPEMQNVDRIIYLGRRLLSIKERIELCGGAPKGW